MALDLIRFTCYFLFALMAIFGTLVSYCYYFQWTHVPADSFWTNEAVNTDGLKWIDINTNGVRLNAASAGNSSNPLVVCLHGFPQTGLLAWHKQYHDLVNAGYYVVMPDLRGYNKSGKPEAIKDYSLDTLAADVVGLIKHLKKDKAILVGHDWGAMIAWWVASVYPEKVEKMVVMNAPHPYAFNQQLSIEQLMKSWYIFFFQLPVIPEEKLKRNDYEALISAMSATAMPGKTFSKDSLQRHKKAWGERRVLTNMINYYRALPFGAKARMQTFEKDPQVKVPTLILWGKHDAVLQESLAQASRKLCPQGSKLALLEASHWVQLEAPKQVNQEIVSFIQEVPSAHM